ncbi:TlpA disulfide reductase family protein [Occallatibacter riparius]|uniref:TlpA family protein disulfide reductase n=1 Tax=Occallatibacter riparius TaxID=1002689 RepID=A0A9J7BYR4_9BACT|nr:TlpA disulfide reductase family protein [Occallatibacter riparius]UWZ86518.1 TlpA family protein disulfide reductase [Occallatibacter riparius]
MKSSRICSAVLFLAVAPALPAQVAQEGGDAIALLESVAKAYASGTDSFRIESIIDSTTLTELRHDWNRTYRTAIKGSGNLYRIEVRTGFGSYVQLSDRTNEWVYQVETNAYIKRPVPADWPKFPKVMDMGFNEMRQAWQQQQWLEETALGYKRARMLPEETLVIDTHRYPCFVVRASSDDSIHSHDKEFHEEVTFWIDKQTHAFRKILRDADSYVMVTPKLHIPMRTETTEIFPVVDFGPQSAPEEFRFTPPADAKEVASLEPDWGGPPPEHPKAQMVGQMAPDVTLAGPDGKKVALSSFRGKPVLIDFWATWCGPCLLSMPSIGRIYADAKGSGLTAVSVDENSNAEDGAVYFERHHYAWPNFHDNEKAIQKAFKGEGVPLTVLLDAQGKIVYYDFGGDEAGLRGAIAGLGPEFASLSDAGTKAPESARKR